MSIRLWQEIAKQKEEVENQRRDILNAFKEKKVVDEMGSLKAEKLFRPITKRLNDPQERPPEEREDFYGNLAVDPFLDHQLGDEMANLFDDGEEFDLTQADQKPELDEEEDFPFPPPELGMEVPQGAKASPGPSRSLPPLYSDIFPTTMSRDDFTKHLSVLNKFIKTNKNNPGAVLKTQNRTLTYEQALEEAYAIYALRASELVQGIPIGKKSLGPFTGKSHREIRKMLKIAEEPTSPPTPKKKTGKGAQRPGGFGSLPSVGSLQSLIPRLTLGISSIFAGNSSLKLREEVKAIAELLFKNGVLSQEQKNKVLSLK